MLHICALLTDTSTILRAMPLSAIGCRMSFCVRSARSRNGRSMASPSSIWETISERCKNSARTPLRAHDCLHTRASCTRSALRAHPSTHAFCTRHTLRTASTLALHVAPCSQVLGELGPFRHFNCLWGEAYIQILKAMFRMTNWKSAPYDVAVHWATKSVMHYRNPKRGSWYEDSVTPSTEFYYDLKSLKSPLADALIQTEPYIHALRFVSQLRRGPDVVRLNDWIIVDASDASCSTSARVDSIAQITRSDSSASYVRLWCAQPRKLCIDAEFSQWSGRCDSLHPMLVKLETTQVRAVTCDVQSTRYVFN